MGQKVNPIGNRLGIIKGWDSNWYGGKDYSAKLVEDNTIRVYLNARLAKASISKIIIERTLKLITVTVNTARPGIIIGKGGQEVDKLKEELKNITKKEVQINIFEVKRPELDATIVANNIARQLEGKVSHRRAIKMSIASTMRMGADGVKVLVEAVNAGMGSVKTAEMAMCPPSVYIPQVAAMLEGSPISLGAQDVNDQESGAHTGEIAANMLTDIGCHYVIVGHSERRAIYGESDVFTARKFAAARKAGLVPILCVGETLEEREQGITEEVVARQLDAVIELEGIAAIADAVIAYEPVWAIGTGKTASPGQAQDVHAFIRNKLAALDSTVAASVRILYGGSMNPANAAELLAMTDIDGGLIGGASLKPDDFLAIGQAANA